MITIELSIAKIVLILILIALPSFIVAISFLIHSITEMRVAKKCVIQVERAKNDERR